jgi:hypothetical protein
MYDLIGDIHDRISKPTDQGGAEFSAQWGRGLFIR